MTTVKDSVAHQRKLIEKTCLKSELATYDPYDVWKTKLGLFVKSNYYSHPKLFFLPAGCFTFFDAYLNNKSRFLYKKQEYPIVRALAAISLLNLYEVEKKKDYLDKAEEHVNWLLKNRIKTPNGSGWGIGFTWPAGKDLTYSSSTPLSTHTPYALEAIFLLSKYNHADYGSIYKEIFGFFENDLKILYEDEDSLAISYGNVKDRIATNATSYALFSYSIFAQVIPERSEYINSKAEKFYNFIIKNQGAKGEWLYLAKDENSFIDCFHSCFILENLIKSRSSFSFVKSESINKGWSYLKENLYDKEAKLFRRFSKKNKVGNIKFDLYDNSEALTTSVLMNDKEMRDILLKTIRSNFCSEDDIYSAITYSDKKINKNTLRWAVMPYVHSLSVLATSHVRDTGIR